MAAPALTRRDFVNAEAAAYLRHYYASIETAHLVLAQTREYVCDCGFRCTGPGQIWDHVHLSHGEPVQADLFAAGGA